MSSLVSKKRVGKVVGKHVIHDQCRFCSSKDLYPFIDFGLVPLAGGFFKPNSTEKDFENEENYPLRVVFCKNCYLVFVDATVAGDTLFRSHYFYFSSTIGSLVNHFNAYALELADLFPAETRSSTLLVELGCNDGVLLKPLKAQGFKVCGVDPATNVITKLDEAGIPYINDYFMPKSAALVKEKYGPADAVLTSNSFAHIDDMHEVMRGVDLLLKEDGILCVEVHYLVSIIEGSQYDMIYHEHMSYYSLIAIENFVAQFNMRVWNVKLIPLHSGSIRFFICRKSSSKWQETEQVKIIRDKEMNTLKLHMVESYKDYYSKVAKTRDDLIALLEKLRAEGKTIWGYGASGRATTITAFCSLTSKYLDGIIDDSPPKQGAFTPYNHLQIHNSSILASDKKPDYVLLLAWPYFNEITKKNQHYIDNGGKFIIPLPELKIVEKQ